MGYKGVYITWTCLHDDISCRLTLGPYFSPAGSKAHMEPVNVTIDIAQPSEANIIHRQMIEEKRREAEKLKKQREDDQRQAEEEARKKEREEWLQREKILLYDKLKDEKGAWIGKGKMWRNA